MNNELRDLLERYGAGELSSEDRRRLADLVSSEEGKRQALVSGCPEAVFLARDLSALPEWENLWDGLEERMAEQTQLKPKSFRWQPIAAAAALIMGAALVFFLILPALTAPRGGDLAQSEEKAREETGDGVSATGVETGEVLTKTFPLKNRQHQEVMAKLGELMVDGDNIELLLDPPAFKITERKEKLEELANIWPQLDRPRMSLRMRLQIRYAEDLQVEQVSAAPVNIDSVALPIGDEIQLVAKDGLQFNSDLEESYKVVFLPELSLEGSEVVIDRLVITVFSGPLEGSTLNLTNVKTALGEWRLLPTGRKNSEGRHIVIALNVDREE